jgi:nicotinate-nucleotide adenylyltransferase
VKAVGIMGGTFDPIHLGHLIAAQSIREIRKLEKIIFIPAFISPFKTNNHILKSAYRLKMIQLAIDEIPYFDYSDLELKRKDISYTIDTLRELKKRYNQIELIIGFDNIIDFNKWKEPDEILEIAKIVVLQRETSIEPKKKDKYYKSAFFVNTPIIEISSSEIRKRVSDNLPIDFLVPDKIKKYIYKNNLYKEKTT